MNLSLYFLLISNTTKPVGAIDNIQISNSTKPVGSIDNIQISNSTKPVGSIDNIQISNSTKPVGSIDNFINHQNNCHIMDTITACLKSHKIYDTCNSDDEHEEKRTLKSFNYDFNEQGKLLHLETGKPYKFNITTDNAYNQSVYEALGEVVTEYVYDLLEEETKLKKLYLPIDRKDNEPQSFIFQSEDALTNPDKLLILVHGTTVVRAGQWSRRCIINDCLDSGTQLPFIKRAVFDGYGVLVLNSNLNKDKNNVNIRGNESQLKHMLYVWDNIVAKAKAKHIAFISHSSGADTTINMGLRRENFYSRTFAVAFTAASYKDDKINDEMKAFLKEKSKNWVETASSEAPAGLAHEMTNWLNMTSIFDFLQKRYKTVKM